MHSQIKICKKCGLKSASSISLQKERILDKLDEFINTSELRRIASDINNKRNIS